MAEAWGVKTHNTHCHKSNDGGAMLPKWEGVCNPGMYNKFIHWITTLSTVQLTDGEEFQAKGLEDNTDPNCHFVEFCRKCQESVGIKHVPLKIKNNKTLNAQSVNQWSELFQRLPECREDCENYYFCGRFMCWTVFHQHAIVRHILCVNEPRWIPHNIWKPWK